MMPQEKCGVEPAHGIGTPAAGREAFPRGYRLTPGERDLPPSPPTGNLRTLLLVLGAVFLAAGLLWPFLSRYVGKLPGDIAIRRPGFTFAFPIVTCLLLSLVLTLFLWLFRR
jgi:hypothetical protein